MTVPINKSEQVKRGCEALVKVCADLKSNESAIIVSDETTRYFGEAIADVAKLVSDRIDHYTIKPLRMHGDEPPEGVASHMKTADVIFGITKMSMAHSQSRFAASQAGARYLSLPDYSFDVLTSPALMTDFRSLTGVANQLADRLTKAKKVSLHTDLGTELVCSIQGRNANPAPGWCWGPGTLASPPDAETNIPPIEDQSNGVIVVDGSIPCPEIGLLKSPIKLSIENGKVVHISGENDQVLNRLFDSANDPNARIVAEFGIGLNPAAVLSGSMLEDEGCRGTVHIGIGANATIGGENHVSFHLDHIIRYATIRIDDEVIMEKGEFKEGVS